MITEQDKPRYNWTRASASLKLNQVGATLLETVMVILIAGILSYAAMVNFSSGSADTQAQAAAKMLMQDLRYAQQVGASSGRGAKVEIDVQNNRYSLRWKDTGAYMTRPMGGGNFIVQFGGGNFPNVSFISTALASGNLYFDASGRPCTVQQPLLVTTDVAALNGGLLIRMSPNTGRLVLIQ